MTLRPLCQFCNEELRPEVGDKGIYDDGWCHELCWWKRECARLTAVIDQLKGTCDGSVTGDRHARHSIGSEPTVFSEHESGTVKDAGGFTTWHGRGK